MHSDFWTERSEVSDVAHDDSHELVFVCVIIFQQVVTMAPLQASGRSRPVAERGESWPDRCAPWPAWVQARVAATEATTTSITTTTKAAGTRPTRTARRTTSLQRRQPSRRSEAGWTQGVAASGTASRCSSTTHLGRRQGSSAGHLFRYSNIQVYVEWRATIKVKYHSIYTMNWQ